MFVGVCTHECRCPRSSEDGVGLHGVVVTGNGELFPGVQGTELGSSTKASHALIAQPHLQCYAPSQARIHGAVSHHTFLFGQIWNIVVVQ